MLRLLSDTKKSKQLRKNIENKGDKYRLDFSGAYIRKASFEKAHLKNVNFRQAQLQDTDFRESQLHGAYFGGAQLQGTDFRRAELQGVYFRTAQLQGTNFEDTKLHGIYFRKAQLRVANFTRAQLQGAYFWEAQLQGAYFWKAQIQWANFEDAQLQGANFEKVESHGTYQSSNSLSFQEQIKQCIGKETKFSEAYQQKEEDALKVIEETITIMKKLYAGERHKKKTIDRLEKVRIKIKESTDVVQIYDLIKDAKTGKLTEEMAREIIIEYNKSMGLVSEQDT